MVGVVPEQIRRDLRRHPESGLHVVRGAIRWREGDPGPAASPGPSHSLSVQEFRWLDLLDMFRDGPVSHGQLVEVWRAAPDEVTADLAPLIRHGYVLRQGRGPRLHYDLGPAFITHPPWSPAEIELILGDIAQVLPRDAVREELLRARTILADWLRVLDAPVSVRRPAHRVVKGAHTHPNILVSHRVAKLEVAARHGRRVRLRYGD